MKPILKILVPVDFSEHTNPAIEAATTLAERFGASVELLHVWQPPHYVSPDLMLSVPGWQAITLEEYGRKEAGRLMEELVGSLNAAPVKVGSRLEVGNPVASILRTAAMGFDLIVMGTHGRTGIARVFMGSTTQQVVAQAVCPVLTVRTPLLPAVKD
jgi:nucleotide-binding universal stress UspA family protein